MPLQSFGDEGNPVLTAGMVMQFEGGVADNDLTNDISQVRDGNFVTGRFAEIYFQGEQTTDSGLVYGARVSLAADTPTRTNTYPGRKFIYFKGNWGSLELGEWIGPSSAMAISPMAQNVSGNGLFDHAAGSYIKAPNSGTAGGFGIDYHVTNGQYLGWFVTDYGDKISYYSPKMGGFQVGVSYQPDSALNAGPVANSITNGNGTGSNTVGAGGFTDVIGAGVTFDGASGDFSYKLSAVGTWGNAKDLAACQAAATTGTCVGVQSNKADDLEAWQIGAQIGYAGLTVAAAYYDDGGSGFREIDGADHEGFTIVGTYAFGPYTIGLNYMNSTNEHNARNATGFAAGTVGSTGTRTTVEEFEFTGIGGGIGYQMAPGLKLYADVGHFDFEGPAGSAENSGIVAYGGVYVSF